MAATPAARAAATSALEHLLQDKVKPAEKILRSTLLQPEATLTLPARTCLLNDLALCALHDNRPGDAVDPMRHALALLPPPRPEAWGGDNSNTKANLQGNAQLQLNLCEALLLSGDLKSTLQRSQP